MLEITDKTDFVLIDLRDEVDFEKYRIVDGRSLTNSAINYPSVLIPRDRFP